MKKNCLLIASLALCLLTIQTGPAQANSGLRDDWKDFYVDVCSELTAAANDCSLCHSSGSSRNDYGQTLESMSFAAAEGVDSDGDGRTNGEEILIDCTQPGDLASAEQLDSWGAIKILFR